MTYPILVYQVLARGACGASWQVTAPPTRDPWLARRRLHEARRYAAGALLAMASTAHALAELVWQLQRDELACPDPDSVGDDWSAATEFAMPATEFAMARPLDERAFLDARRWQLERGPGGDHDQPYTFALPSEGRVVLAWVRLLARVRAERTERADPGAPGNRADLAL